MRRKAFFFALSASMLMGKLPAALEGALGMGNGLQDAPRLGEPPAPLALDPRGGLGGSGKVGGWSWELEKVCGV